MTKCSDLQKPIHDSWQVENVSGNVSSLALLLDVSDMPELDIHGNSFKLRFITYSLKCHLHLPSLNVNSLLKYNYWQILSLRFIKILSLLCHCGWWSSMQMSQGLFRTYSSYFVIKKILGDNSVAVVDGWESRMSRKWCWGTKPNINIMTPSLIGVYQTHASKPIVCDMVTTFDKSIS